MKRTRLMMILQVLVILLLLQLSCATPKKGQDYIEPQASSGQAQTADVIAVDNKAPVSSGQVQRADVTASEVKEIPAEALLLGDKHQANGMSCKDCHEETPPASDVPTSVCMTCHGDYKEVAASYIDPHNAHTEYTNCGDCHHSHRASENQCLGCHSFNLQAP